MLAGKERPGPLDADAYDFDMPTHPLRYGERTTADGGATPDDPNAFPALTAEQVVTKLVLSPLMQGCSGLANAKQDEQYLEACC